MSGLEASSHTLASCGISFFVWRKDFLGETYIETAIDSGLLLSSCMGVVDLSMNDQ
jgi:hypothetical protein